MSSQSVIEEPMSKPAIHQAIGPAIGTVLAFVAIATAFMIAAYPAFNGQFIAVATGLGIGAIALAASVAAAAFFRHRLPSNNDGWVFW